MIRTRSICPVILAFALALSAPPAHAAKTAAKKASKPAPTRNLPVRAADPYAGAIVIDADSGNVLFEDKADQPGYPASIVKLMDLLIVIEKIEQGALKPEDKVTVTAEVCSIGGSQAWLKEHEVFTVDEMLYALIVRSANDVAVALALHLTGSKEAFVQLMNKRAAELGMKNTRFESVHGLPPGKGQKPDVTTARDLAILSREIVRHPAALKYTSTVERTFRPQAKEPLLMQTHNRLLRDLEGCDGLKTGYWREAGFSLAATAVRNGRRLIVVVLGSSGQRGLIRDAKARELITTAFLNLPPAQTPPPANTNAPAKGTNSLSAAPDEEDDDQAAVSETRKARLPWIIAGSCLLVLVLIGLLRLRSISQP